MIQDALENFVFPDEIKTKLMKMNKLINFFNLRAKRGGSLFEAGSEREENGGVTSVQKRCA